MPAVTKIILKDVSSSKKTWEYRSPLKFGEQVISEIDVVKVQVTVESENGKMSATGHSSMPLGISWAWPTNVLSNIQKTRIIKGLVDKIHQSVVDIVEPGHPIDIGLQIAEHAVNAAKELESIMKLVEPIPELAVMLACAALDNAIYDAFGRINCCSTYQTLGSEFFTDDLSRYLGSEFAGKHFTDYFSDKPKNTLALCHTIGGLDPLSREDLGKPIHDGLPETLEQWLEREGITHLKIKLDGANIDWDVGRVIEINRIANRMTDDRKFTYSLDFNEQCAGEDYVLEFLERVDRLSHEIVQRTEYIEQPTNRDLKARKDITMHRVARIKEIIIDESLVDIDMIRFAKQQGYTGIALKTCKTLTKSLLMAAVASEYKMFMTVQDLTLVGSAFLQSASFAAHLPKVSAVEGNGRQYCPDPNWDWEAKYRPLFHVRSGVIPTELLDAEGLGCDIPPKRSKKKLPPPPPPPKKRRVAAKSGPSKPVITPRKVAKLAEKPKPAKPVESAASQAAKMKAKKEAIEKKTSRAKEVAEKKATKSAESTSAKKKSTSKSETKTATSKTTVAGKSSKAKSSAVRKTGATKKTSKTKTVKTATSSKKSSAKKAPTKNSKKTATKKVKTVAKKTTKKAAKKKSPAKKLAKKTTTAKKAFAKARKKPVKKK